MTINELERDKIYKLYFKNNGVSYWKSIKRINKNGLVNTSNGLFYNGEPYTIEIHDHLLIIIDNERKKTLKQRLRNKNLKNLLN